MFGWNFDGVCVDVKKKWNECLLKIVVKINDEDQCVIFYMVMYYVFLSFNLFIDVDGCYLGMDLKVYIIDMKYLVYIIFFLWDIFCVLYLLLIIVDFQLNMEFICLLIKKYQEGGIFLKWDCVFNYIGIMVGYYVVLLVIDFYVKGYCDFDVQEVYKVCLCVVEYDIIGIVVFDWLILYVMFKVCYYKNIFGYILCDCENELVVKVLEYVYDDWCIFVLVDSLGDIEIKEKYVCFVDVYEFYFDFVICFMCGLDSKGEWCILFNFCFFNYCNDDYCEGIVW